MFIKKLLSLLSVLKKEEVIVSKEGVIVGIIDTGINFCHPAFRKEDGTTRILYFKSYNGIELNNKQINQKIAKGDCNYDYDGHGTGVASVAGGNKDISLIVYQTNFYTDDIVKALKYIKAKAQKLKMPVVVNMSFGGHIDPHDGTGIIDRKIDEVSGEGFIVVASAGNYGNKRIHAQVISGVVDLEILNNNEEISIDGWYDKGTTYRVSVCSGDSCVSAEPKQVKSGSVASCKVKIDNSVLSSSLNGDGNVYISLRCSKPEKLTLKFERLSGDGKIDLWISSNNAMFLNGCVEDDFGGYKYTIISPGTARRAITVGSTSSSSSRGPTRDGRIKPEVLVNGDSVSVANYKFSETDPDSYYIKKSGTSLAAALVTSLIASYLKNNPKATPEQVKEWLISKGVCHMGAVKICIDKNDFE